QKFCDKLPCLHNLTPPYSNPLRQISLVVYLYNLLTCHLQHASPSTLLTHTVLLPAPLSLCFSNLFIPTNSFHFFNNPDSYQEYYFFLFYSNVLLYIL